MRKYLKVGYFDSGLIEINGKKSLEIGLCDSLIADCINYRKVYLIILKMDLMLIFIPRDIRNKFIKSICNIGDEHDSNLLLENIIPKGYSCDNFDNLFNTQLSNFLKL